MVIRIVVLCFLGAAMSAGIVQQASADTRAQASSQQVLNEDDHANVRALLVEELGQRFPKTRIEITSPLQLTRGKVEAELRSLKILSISPRGEILASIETASADTGASTFGELKVSFSAWMDVPVATRRVLPGEKLSSEQFRIQPVNVAQGQAFEYRGVIVPKEFDLSKVEARQTILEGQYLLATAIQRIPDIRRGDLVKIEMSSGGLLLSTQGKAEEPGFMNQPLRVMTMKTKRELVGQLRMDGVVEVKL